MGNKEKAGKRKERLLQEKHKRHFQKPPPPPQPVDEIVLKPGVALLRQEGVLVKARFQVPQGLATILQKNHQPVPKPLIGFVLVDTGASQTAISESAAQDLGLKPRGMRNVAGVAGNDQRPTYFATITLTDFVISGQFEMVAVKDMKYVGADKSRRLIGLLGRDFLQHAHLGYDGPKGEVKITVSRDTLAQVKPVAPIVRAAESPLSSAHSPIALPSATLPVPPVATEPVPTSPVASAVTQQGNPASQ